MRWLCALAYDVARPEEDRDAALANLRLVMRRHGAQDADSVEKLIFEEGISARVLSDFELGDEVDFAEELGAALASAYLAQADGAEGAIARVEGIAVPRRVENGTGTATTPGSSTST